MLTLKYRQSGSSEVTTFTWKLNDTMLRPGEMSFSILSLAIDGPEFAYVDRDYQFTKEPPENYGEQFGDVVRIGKESVEFTGGDNVAYEIVEMIYLRQLNLRELAALQRDARISGYIDDSS